MYATENFKTKAAFKRAVAEGRKLTVYSPGLGQPPANGITHVEGPHFPAPHTWYAEVTMKDGYVAKVV